MGRRTVLQAENQAGFRAMKAIDTELQNGWYIRKKRVLRGLGSSDPFEVMSQKLLKESYG